MLVTFGDQSCILTKVYGKKYFFLTVILKSEAVLVYFGQIRLGIASWFVKFDSKLRPNLFCPVALQFLQAFCCFIT